MGLRVRIRHAESQHEHEVEGSHPAGGQRRTTRRQGNAGHQGYHRTDEDRSARAEAV